MSALLEATNVSKRFGGIEALSGVSSRCPAGQIIGLIGPERRRENDPVQSAHRPVPLEPRFLSARRRRARGHEADRVAARGIARTFQNIRLFANLSALENVMIAGTCARARVCSRGAARPGDARRGRGSSAAERSCSTTWASSAVPGQANERRGQPRNSSLRWRSPLRDAARLCPRRRAERMPT